MEKKFIFKTRFKKLTSVHFIIGITCACAFSFISLIVNLHHKYNNHQHYVLLAVKRDFFVTYYIAVYTDIAEIHFAKCSIQIFT